MVCSSIKIHLPTKIARCDENIACFNSVSIFALGFLFQQVGGSNGLVISRKHLNYLWHRTPSTPLNKWWHKSLTSNISSVCDLSFRLTPGDGLKTLDIDSAKCCLVSATVKLSNQEYVPSIWPEFTMIALVFVHAVISSIGHFVMLLSCIFLFVVMNSSYHSKGYKFKLLLCWCRY